MIYSEEHVDRIVHEKFVLKDQVEVLTRALKDAQKHISALETLVKVLTEIAGDEDKDEDGEPVPNESTPDGGIWDGGGNYGE